MLFIMLIINNMLIAFYIKKIHLPIPTEKSLWLNRVLLKKTNEKVIHHLVAKHPTKSPPNGKVQDFVIFANNSFPNNIAKRETKIMFTRSFS